MFFGLTNSPATFQAIMNDILRDLINTREVVAFMNDILVGTEYKGDWAQDSRRILSNITDCGYGTTYLQENP